MARLSASPHKRPQPSNPSPSTRADSGDTARASSPADGIARDDTHSEPAGDVSDTVSAPASTASPSRSSSPTTSEPTTPGSTQSHADPMLSQSCTFLDSAYDNKSKGPRASRPAARRSVMPSEGPLVLLHVTILPFPQLPRPRANLSPQTLTRGLLISHPGPDFSLIQERVLSVLGLLANEEEKHAEDEQWGVQVFASSGLMTAEAWAVAWEEMERIDVEISPPAIHPCEDVPLDLPMMDVEARLAKLEYTLREDKLASAEAFVMAETLQERVTRLEEWHEQELRRRAGHKGRTRVRQHAGSKEPVESDGRVVEYESQPEKQKVSQEIDSPLEVLLGRYLCRLALDTRNLVILVLLAITAVLISQVAQRRSEAEVRYDACEMLGRTIADSLSAMQVVQVNKAMEALETVVAHEAGTDVADGALSVHPPSSTSTMVSVDVDVEVEVIQVNDTAWDEYGLIPWVEVRLDQP